MNSNPSAFPSRTIRWEEITPENLEDSIRQALTVSRKNVDNIAAIPLEDVNFVNTVEALEFATLPLDLAWGKASHLNGVRDSKPFRQAYNRVLEPVSAFYDGIPLNDAIWERLRAFNETSEAEELNGIQRRLFEETWQDFIEGGANLSANKKARLREISSAVSQKTQRYNEHVLDATDGWEKILENPADLDGLPAGILEILAADAKAHGRENAYRLTLQAPIYVPSMRYLKADALREELWRAFSQLGKKQPFDNTTLINEILTLRKEESALLGKANYADLTLSRRMAKTGSNALQFVEDFHRRVRKQFQREVTDLEAFRAKQLGQKTERLQPWQVSFWSELQCRNLYGFEEEQLRLYFEINTTLRGLFEILEMLYGVRFAERKTTMNSPIGDEVSVWHSSVRYFEIREADGRFIAAFYLDLFPREGKRSGAWYDGIRPGYQLADGQWIPPVGIVATNLTPSTPDRPSLLTHDEVETLFHEFGHLMHGSFGIQPYPSLNGTNVPVDFVEMPSQLMENWTWQPEILRRFARHYETGEILPNDLMEKMIETRNYLIAMATMRQLSLAKMDLELHMNYDDAPIDEFIDRVSTDYVIDYKTPSPSIIRHFLHLFGHGYAAAYYSYKWSEVLDADVFGKFKAAGLLNSKVGNDFRRKILERGNRVDADQLFRDFMGRGPSLDGLLARDGLTK